MDECKPLPAVLGPGARYPKLARRFTISSRGGSGGSGDIGGMTTRIFD